MGLRAEGGRRERRLRQADGGVRVRVRAAARSSQRRCPSSCPLLLPAGPGQARRPRGRQKTDDDCCHPTAMTIRPTDAQRHALLQEQQHPESYLSTAHPQPGSSAAVARSSIVSSPAAAAIRRSPSLASLPFAIFNRIRSHLPLSLPRSSSSSSALFSSSPSPAYPGLAALEPHLALAQTCHAFWRWYAADRGKWWVDALHEVGYGVRRR